MGVDLTITRSGGLSEHYGIGSMHVVPNWIRRVAAEQSFKVLDGTFPVWVYPHTLAQVIAEVTLLRDDIMQEWARQTGDPANDFTSDVERLNRVLAALDELRAESDWDALLG